MFQTSVPSTWKYVGCAVSKTACDLLTDGSTALVSSTTSHLGWWRLARGTLVAAADAAPATIPDDSL